MKDKKDKKDFEIEEKDITEEETDDVVFEELNDECKDKKGLKIVKVDIDEEPGIPAKYSVMSVPTFIFVKNNKVVDTVVGAVPKETLMSKIDKQLGEK